MKDRIQMYERAIQELHEARMKQVKLPDMITDMILISGSVVAFILGVLIATPFF